MKLISTKIKRIIAKSRSFMCLSFLSLCTFWYYIHRKTPSNESYKPPVVSTNTKAVETFTMALSASYPAKKLADLKYILLWTTPTNVPFVYLEEGRSRFIKNRCRHTNCYVTSDRNYFDDYTQFDVIVFSAPEVVNAEVGLPSRRSEDQKYVFASIESSYSYPLCSDRFDGYFNWTWTYRLDSDSRWGYLVVRDIHDKIIGPKKVMHWMKVEDMEPLSKEFKESLWSKYRAVAWFVSNCDTNNKREAFARNLEIELQTLGISLDKYGDCGLLLCPKEDQAWCNEKIKKSYYFYLAFENSFGEDYVTEKVLHGLRNNAVPVVYGGANYTRFMPQGIYLDGRELGPKKLAEKMNELMRNPDEYSNYFKWKSHYKYFTKSESPETDDYCNMCKLLNDKKMMKKKTVYKNLRQWWDPPNVC